MANHKENVYPPTPSRHDQRQTEDQYTPPWQTAGTSALGMKGWQSPGFASPPLKILSPSNKPTLKQQRDHSACRRPDTPLRVRKTRENLRQNYAYPEIPPPCVHCGTGDDSHEHNTTSDSIPSASDTFANEISMEANTETSTTTPPSQPFQSFLNVDKSLPLDPPRSPSPPPQPTSKMHRHKSVSRRMLSRVREGITNRSKTSRSIRPAGSETSLARTVSGKRKESSELHNERRGGSLDFGSRYISRQNHHILNPSAGLATDTSPPQRSCTGTTASTSDLWDRSVSSFGVESEPATLFPGYSSSSISFSGASPAIAAMEQSPDKTPRPLPRTFAALPSGDGASRPLQVPFVEVQCWADIETLDVSRRGEVWVVVEACVRLHTASVEDSGKGTENVDTAGVDAIVLLDVSDASPRALGALCDGIIALVRSLGGERDRVAVTVVKEDGPGMMGLQLLCDLAPPDVEAVRATLAHVAIANDHGENLPMETQLRDIAGILESRNVRLQAAQAFVFSASSSQTASELRKTVSCPVHRLIIGSGGTPTLPSPSTELQDWMVNLSPFANDEAALTNQLKEMIGHLRTSRIIGAISTLKLNLKPSSGARILETLGQKSLKDLRPGQTASLSIRLAIPALESSRLAPPPQSSAGDTSRQDTLFMELESLVGTLETEILQVEARYKHTLFPGKNTVTVRKCCHLKRPDGSSRWSVPSLLRRGEDRVRKATDEVYERLAAHLAGSHEPRDALVLFERYTQGSRQGSSGGGDGSLERIRGILGEEMRWREAGQVESTTRDESEFALNSAPLLTVTDTSFPFESSGVSTTTQPKQVVDPEEHFSTAPCTPLTEDDVRSTFTSATSSGSTTPAITSRSLTPNSFAPLPLHGRLEDGTNSIQASTVPPTTTYTPNQPDSVDPLGDCAPIPYPSKEEEVKEEEKVPDSARQIWHQMRRTSQPPTSTNLSNPSRPLDPTILQRQLGSKIETTAKSDLPLQSCLTSRNHRGSTQDDVLPFPERHELNTTSPSDCAAVSRVEALRREALRNKRSVGAETLRDWRWEEEGVGIAGAGAGAEGIGRVGSDSGVGVTPWL